MRFLRGVEVWHRVAIGVEHDVAAGVGADRPNDGAVVGSNGKRAQPGLFLGEVFEWFAVGPAMETEVGDGVAPDDGGWVDGGEGRNVQAGEEVLLHVADAIFHAPLFVAFGDMQATGRKP